MTAIEDRIADVFNKDNPEYEYVESYLAELRTNWRENEKGITRFSGLVVALSVAFGFLFQQSCGTTFLAIKLTNTSILELSLIVIVSYLYYGVIYAFVESQVFFDAVTAPSCEKYNPALSGARGEFLLSLRIPWSAAPREYHMQWTPD